MQNDANVAVAFLLKFMRSLISFRISRIITLCLFSHLASTVHPEKFFFFFFFFLIARPRPILKKINQMPCHVISCQHNKRITNFRKHEPPASVFLISELSHERPKQKNDLHPLSSRKVKISSEGIDCINSCAEKKKINLQQGQL